MPRPLAKRPPGTNPSADVTPDARRSNPAQQPAALADFLPRRTRCEATIAAAALVSMRVEVDSLPRTPPLSAMLLHAVNWTALSRQYLTIGPSSHLRNTPSWVQNARVKAGVSLALLATMEPVLKELHCDAKVQHLPLDFAMFKSLQSLTVGVRGNYPKLVPGVGQVRVSLFSQTQHIRRLRIMNVGDFECKLDEIALLPCLEEFETDYCDDGVGASCLSQSRSLRCVALASVASLDGFESIPTLEELYIGCHSADVSKLGGHPGLKILEVRCSQPVLNVSRLKDSRSLKQIALHPISDVLDLQSLFDGAATSIDVELSDSAPRRPLPPLKRPLESLRVGRRLLVSASDLCRLPVEHLSCCTALVGPQEPQCFTSEVLSTIQSLQFDLTEKPL